MEKKVTKFASFLVDFLKSNIGDARIVIGLSKYKTIDNVEIDNSRMQNLVASKLGDVNVIMCNDILYVKTSIDYKASASGALAVLPPHYDYIESPIEGDEAIIRISSLLKDPYCILECYTSTRTKESIVLEKMGIYVRTGVCINSQEWGLDSKTKDNHQSFVTLDQIELITQYN